MNDCVFCNIVKNDPHGQILRKRVGTVVFEPLNPVTPGHLLVVPTSHVKDASEIPTITGMAMVAAAEEAQLAGQCNIITSVGPAATQTVFHLHIHIVPRREGDGLLLPWSEVNW